MNSPTDQQLLRDYARNGSETAFAELVRRHLDFVHSAALRMVRDPHLAEDVSQSVFVALARNASQLADRPVLSGWLHRTAQNLAANVVRSDVRRRVREQKAAVMNELLTPEADPPWEHVAPHLDAALGELNEPDRDAVLLRYFERKSAREMAQTLGTSEEAAQKRVTRAVERLRELFADRGVTVGASGLVTVISTNAVQAAPAGLALTISTAAAFAGTATAATGTATKAIVMTTLQKSLIATAIVAGVATTLVVQHRSGRNLQDENQVLRQQVAQLQMDIESLRSGGARRSALRLSAPPMLANNALVKPAEDLVPTNLIDSLLRGEQPPKLTADQLEKYLNANHRSAASLLAAYRTSGDPALLEEAMQRFPDDPQVAFEAAFKKDATPEQRRHWIEAFKKSAADNALPNYLSALDHFKAGQAGEAVRELIAASGKQEFRDYTLDRMQDDEEAYLAAGYAMAEAKTVPAWQLLLPQLAQIKELSQHMIDLANSYRQAGDPVSAQSALQMAADLGQRYANNVAGETQISRLVGMAVERNALNAMDPNTPYGGTGHTVKDQLDYIAQQTAGLKETARQVEALQPMMSNQDWISYKDRWRVFGEEAAAKWLINKYGRK